MEKNMKKKWYRSWAIHNICSHPAAEILRRLGLDELADWVHDVTVPPKEP